MWVSIVVTSTRKDIKTKILKITPEVIMRSLLLLILSQFLFLTSTHAVTSKVTEQEIKDYLSKNNNARQLNQLISNKIVADFNDGTLTLNPGGSLTYAEYPPDVVKKTGCTHRRKHIYQSIKGKFDGDTGVTTDFSDITDHIETTVILDGSLIAKASDRHWFGAKLPLVGCVDYLRNTAHVTVTANVKLHVKVRVDFESTLTTNPDGSAAYALTPVADVSANAVVYNTKASISGSNGYSDAFWNTAYTLKSMFDFIETGSTYNRNLNIDFQNSLNEKVDLAETFTTQLNAELQGNYTVLVDAIDFQVASTLGEDLGLGVIDQYIYDHRQEILFYLMTNDDAALDELLTSPTAIASCAAALPTLMSTSPKGAPTYTNNGGTCHVFNTDQEFHDAGLFYGNYFTDAGCANQITFFPANRSNYCRSILDKSILGNANVFFASNSWTVPLGTRLNLNVASSVNNIQPYMLDHKVPPVSEYYDSHQPTEVCNKGGCTIQSVAQYCKIGIRVYKPDIKQTGLKPAMMIHGGSWKYRTTGFSGLETHISHLTQRGYVVFTPFYSLTGDADGPRACQNRDHVQITNDINRAFKWVLANSATFGAKGKVTLMGQSAGAHLALTLATGAFATSVDKAVLFYPPTDFKDMIRQMQDGTYTNEAGMRAVGRYLNMDLTGPNLANINLNDPLVLNNTFTEKVAANPAAYPPMYILHGVQDKIVPSSQSVRLCNAMSGSVFGNTANDGGIAGTGPFMKRYNCGTNGSVLDLFAESDHVFDICHKLGITSGTCAAGPNSIPTVKSSILNAYNWLKPL